MKGPFNNPNVDDTGFYVPVLRRSPFGPTGDGLAANQFATVVVKPHPGQQAGERSCQTLQAAR